MGAVCCSDRKGQAQKPVPRFQPGIETQVRALESKYEEKLLKVINEFVLRRLHEMEIPSFGNKEEMNRKRTSLKGADTESNEKFGRRESQSKGTEEKLPSLLFEVSNIKLQGSRLQKDDLKIRLRRPGQGYSVALLSLKLDLRLSVRRSAEWSYEFTGAPYLRGNGKLAIKATASAVLGLNYIDDYWVLDQTGAVRSMDLELDVQESWLSSAYEAALWMAKEKVSETLKNVLNKEIGSTAAEYLQEDEPQAILGDVKEELLAIFGLFPPDASKRPSVFPAPPDAKRSSLQKNDKARRA
mmetsp:Transcript_89537/g.158949  ORF Transcript_89537/g.158949 Transcript_89537/m.158949 type:complete len:298 (-) Transcript_89537:72-965(-)